MAAAAPKKPVAPPANSAAPGAVAPKEKVKKEKKEKIVKIAHPSLANDAKIKVRPEDFDPKIHQPLKKKNFEDEPAFLEYQATILDRKAAEVRAQAEKIRKLGTNAGNTKVKKLLQMRDRMAELLAMLKAEGQDVDALMNG